MRRLIRIIRERCGSEAGFTMPVVVLAMFATTSIGVAAVGAARDDIGLQRTDTYEKQALAAAQAGLTSYTQQLFRDPQYWIYCDGQNTSNADGTVAGASTVLLPGINDAGAAAPSARQWRSLAGVAAAEYTIDLVPANGQPSCDVLGKTREQTMIDASTNTFSIAITGRAGSAQTVKSRWARRTLVANFKRKGFLDFVYFTDLETPHPIYYDYSASTKIGSATNNRAWAEAHCVKYFRSGRKNELKCEETAFSNGDKQLGPFHTNDSVMTNGDVTWGRDASDRIEITGDKLDPPANTVCYNRQAKKDGCNTAIGFMNGTLRIGPVKAPRLVLPKTLDELEYWGRPAKGGLTLNGAHEIQLMTTTPGKIRYRPAYSNTNPEGGWTEVVIAGTSNAVPSGVIYVKDLVGCSGFQPDAPEPAGYLTAPQPQPLCGDALVEGNYSDTYLTIAAQNDILITNDIEKVGTDASMLGLVGEKFVRMRRPDGGGAGCPAQQAVRLEDVQGALLALTGSFVADKFWCDNKNGINSGDKFEFRGGYAQKFRGPLGMLNGGGSNYNGYQDREYNFDDRLRFRSPPHFVNPEFASWAPVRVREQAPPNCAGCS